MKKASVKTFPVLIEQDEDGMYIASVPSLRSCHTQAKTLDELYKNLEEAVALCIESEKEFFGSEINTKNRIVGFQNLQFKVS